MCQKADACWRRPVERLLVFDYLAESARTLPARRDFLLAAAFLCKTPFATALSITS